MQSQYSKTLLISQPNLLKPMPDNILGETTLESMPKDLKSEVKNNKNQNWTIFLILVLVFSVVIFYLNQTSTTAPKPGLHDLESSALEVNIPNYSDNF